MVTPRDNSHGRIEFTYNNNGMSADTNRGKVGLDMRPADRQGLGGIKGWKADSNACSKLWTWFCKDVLGSVIEVKIGKENFLVGKESALAFINRNQIPCPTNIKKLSINLQNQAIKSCLESYANPGPERTKKPAAAPTPTEAPAPSKPATMMSLESWKDKLKDFKVTIDENFLKSNGFEVWHEEPSTTLWKIDNSKLEALMAKFAPAKTEIEQQLKDAVVSAVKQNPGNPAAQVAAAAAAIAGDGPAPAPAKPHPSSTGPSSVSRTQQEAIAQQAAAAAAARAPASPNMHMVPASPAKAAPTPAQDSRVGLPAGDERVASRSEEEERKSQFGTLDLANPKAERLPNQWVNLFATITGLQLDEQIIRDNFKNVGGGKYVIANHSEIVAAIIKEFKSLPSANQKAMLKIFEAPGDQIASVISAIKTLLPSLAGKIRAIAAPAPKAIEAPPAVAASLSAAKSISLEDCPSWLKNDGNYVNSKSDELNELETNLEAAFEKSPAVLTDELCFYVAKRIDSSAGTKKGIDAEFDVNLKKLPTNTKARLNAIANLFPKWKKAQDYFSKL